MDDDVLMTIIAEAFGEGPEGMRRVGETILNRAAIRGLTPEQVVRQPNQYTGFSAPGPAALAAQKDPRAITAAEAAWELAKRPGDPTNGADHYHADYVNPYWADNMPSTGSFGRHSFYASQPVPEEALARLLAPETRNVPLPRARPASPMDQIAAMFAGSFNGGGNRADTATGLNQYVERSQNAPRSITANDMVFGSGIADSHQAATSAQPQGLAAILEAFVRPKAPLTTGARQTYAAQDVKPPRFDMHAMNGDTGGERVEGEFIPVRAPSGVGQPPSTRTVQSVPVPRQAAPQMTTAQIRADNGQTRPIPSQNDGLLGLAMMFDTTPYAAGSVNNQKGQERLAQSDKIINRSDTPVAAGMGETRLPVDGTDWTVALPRKRPDSNSTNSRVAVTHQQVANPEYQRLLQQISRGEAQMRGVSTTGRPISRDSYQATRASQASIDALRRALASTPKTVQQPLRVQVNGAGSYNAPEISPETFKGTHSGRTYTEGQRYTMGGDTYTANAAGGFTNDRTGRTQGTGSTWYNPDTNRFEKR